VLFKGANLQQQSNFAKAALLILCNILPFLVAQDYGSANFNSLQLHNWSIITIYYARRQPHKHKKYKYYEKYRPKTRNKFKYSKQVNAQC